MLLALRLIRRQPGFTLAVVLTLALGIGATSSIFSVLNAVMLRPLAYKDAERLAIVWESNPALGMPVPGAKVQVSTQNYLSWVETQGPFEELGAFANRDFSLTGVDMPEAIRGFRATANLLPMLGARAQIGRLFGPGEDVPGRDQVVVLSDGFWRRKFGGSPDVLGRRLLLDGEPREVVGVLPAGLEEPARWEGYQSRPDVWVPMAFTSDERTSASNHHRILYPIGRLRPGVTVQAARDGMIAIGRDLGREFPQRNDGWTVNVVPLQAERVSERVRQGLVILLVAAGMVLLIASFNIGHLLLARTAARRKEFAIRTALGASQIQVVRQLLGEAAVLGALGGALGVVLSHWGTPLLLRLQSGMIHRVEEVTVDWRVLLFALALTMTTVLGFGLAPLRIAKTENLKPALSGSGAWLLASEAFLTVILLAASGLLVRSMWKLMDVDLGLRVDRVLSIEIKAKDARFFEELSARVRALPGVDSVGTASNLPMQALLGGRVRTGSMASKDALGADFRVVDAGYFTTLGIPILQGRGFTESEAARGDARVAVVDATLARRLSATGDVVGTSIISVDWPQCKESCRIIGVSGAIRQLGPEQQARPEIILPGRWKTSSLIVRSRRDGAELGPAVRRAIADLDGQQPAGKMETMATSLAGITEERRFNLALAAVFAGFAILLATIGVFAVAAFAVSQRVREFAIRTAVGAKPYQVMTEALRRPLIALAAGCVLGLTAAVPLMTSLRHYLYGVEPMDWPAYTCAALVLFTAGAAALVLPARRALRVDPATALRHD